MKKNKSLIIFGGLILAVGVLLWFGRQASVATAVYWQDTDIQCLQYGHENISLHIHPTLTITVDGERETVPANVGVTNTCMAEVHTHDVTGEIHIESGVANRTFTLADFFTVWGRTVSRDGYTHEVTINGNVVDDIASHTLADRDRIAITYTSAN